MCASMGQLYCLLELQLFVATLVTLGQQEFAFWVLWQCQKSYDGDLCFPNTRLNLKLDLILYLLALILRPLYS